MPPEVVTDEGAHRVLGVEVQSQVGSSRKSTAGRCSMAAASSHRAALAQAELPDGLCTEPREIDILPGVNAGDSPTSPWGTYCFCYAA
ncbi:hypothetical protein [Acrocarpospora sp. B8E8]|uniref:hypothetical protein n=1 Tax=Acrocarpospora sp. B8E8 TaxID=3153572 RepID=UPI00325E7103